MCNWHITSYLNCDLVSEWSFFPSNYKFTTDAAASWHFCILLLHSNPAENLSMTFLWIIQDLVRYFQLWNFMNIFGKLLHFAFLPVHNNSAWINHLHIIISKTLITKPSLVITTFDVIQWNENTTNFYGGRCMETKPGVL